MVFLLPCSSTVADLGFVIDIIQLLVLGEEPFLLRAFSMARNATLSKAPSISRNVPRAIPEFRMALLIL